MSSLVNSIASSIKADDKATMFEASLDMRFTDSSVNVQNAYSSELSDLQDKYETEAANIADPQQPYKLAKDWSEIQNAENAENQVNAVTGSEVATANSSVQGLSADEASEYQADGALGSFCTFMQNVIASGS